MDFSRAGKTIDRGLPVARESSTLESPRALWKITYKNQFVLIEFFILYLVIHKVKHTIIGHLTLG